MNRTVLDVAMVVADLRYHLKRHIVAFDGRASDAVQLDGKRFSRFTWLHDDGAYKFAEALHERFAEIPRFNVFPERCHDGPVGVDCFLFESYAIDGRGDLKRRLSLRISIDLPGQILGQVSENVYDSQQSQDAQSRIRMKRRGSGRALAEGFLYISGYRVRYFLD